MGWQDDPLVEDTPQASGTQPAWLSDPIVDTPSQADANHTFATTIGNSIRKNMPAIKDGANKMLTTTEDIGSVYPAVEASVNAATGVLFGFPAYLVGAIGGLTDKYLLGGEADPKQVAEAMQKIFTYQPHTERGLRLTGNLMYPLEKLTEGSQYVGEKTTDFATKVGASPNMAAAAGAITDSTLQMLGPTLFGELGRKMGGQVIGPDDFSHVSSALTDKTLPIEEAAPQAHVIENSLRETYQQTGIGPYTVMADAMKNPEIKADLVNPDVGLPKAYVEHTEPPPAVSDGLPNAHADGPILDVSGPTVEEAKAGVKPVEDTNPFLTQADGTINMHSGINPAEAIANVRDSYTPFVGVESPNAPKAPVETEVSPLKDAIQKLFTPASRGDIAEQQAGIMRANLGEQAHQRELALTKLQDYAASFDKMPVKDNIKFIDAYEHGTALSNPKWQEAAQALKELNDSKREEIQALGNGQLENFDENWLGRIWKNPEAERDMSFGSRSLEGNKNLLKTRTIPYYTDGLKYRSYDGEGNFIKSYDTEAQAKVAAGSDGRVGQPLEPVTTNPVEMALLKAREADKYIYGQKIFQEMKQADLARFVRFGERPPIGWTKINDKVARVLQPSEEGGMIIRGEYYAPDEAATLINNHLSSGLQGNGFYDAWRGVGMAMNSLQLGLSAFHVGFTTMDSMVSKVSLGVKQIARGDIVEGVSNVAQGANPAQPFMNLYKGDKLLRAYLGKLNDPDLAPIVDAIVQAGGRVKMDDFYRNAQVNAFKQALRGEDYKTAAKELIPTILDRVSAPIFEQLVPRQKLGVYFDMAQDWIKNNPNADLATKRTEMGKMWDSVDNRMGQLVYDNVFWNRALKDGLMATVRSVGWNLGTFRELGGGIGDLKDVVKKGGITDRTAYVIALPLLAGVYGAMTNYLYTGEPPRDMKDCFFPRTGRLRPDGSEDRVSLPTYMKDVFSYGEDIKNSVEYGADPTQTLKNKAHPLIATISQMLNNEDFLGGAIRNPADPAVKQAQDTADYLIKQFEPFSLRNYEQQTKLRKVEPSVGDYLTSPSMIGVTPAPGYIVKSDAELESAQVSRLHDSLEKKFRQTIKDGGKIDDLIPEMINSGFTRKDIKFIIKSSGDTPLPHRLKHFGNEDDNEE